MLSQRNGETNEKNGQFELINKLSFETKFKTYFGDAYGLFIIP